jgi:hypothetical protein
MHFLKLTSQIRPATLFTILTRNHVTTHYTIVPREKDERWKGMQSIYSIIFLKHGQVVVNKSLN